MGWTFNGVSFDFLDAQLRSPDWRHTAFAVQTPLLGTDRFVDQSNGGQWRLAGTLTIPPGAGAASAYAALRTAYRSRTVATIDDGAGGTWQAVILTFDVAPLVSGVAGYEGAITFGRPNG